METNGTPALALTRTQAYVVKHYGAAENEPWCYHTQFSYHLRIQQLVLPLFYKAVHSVLHRHPVVRTVLVRDDAGELKQLVQPRLKLPIQFEDLSALPVPAQADRIAHLLRQDRQRPFTPYGQDKPLCRSYILKRSAESVQLILVFHHAIWDGWSLAVLLREIFAHYQLLLSQPTAALPAADYDYRAFVREAAAPLPASAHAAWRQHLAPHQAFAPAHKFRSVPYEDYAPVEVGLAPELIARLADVQRRWRVTMKSIFIGLLVRLVQEEARQSHVTIGVVTNGRGVALPNPLTTLGLLWHFTPLCVENVAGTEAQVRQVNQKMAEVAAYGVCPLDELLPDRQLPGLFHAAFNFINFEGVNLLPADSGIEFLEVGGLDKFPYPLHLLVGKNPFTKQLSLVMNYDARCYSRPQVAAMLAAYVQRLEELGSGTPAPGMPSSTYPSALPG